MGAVLQATHILRKASVALKFMNPEITMREGYVERFLNEAVAASRIDSEHVVKVFDVGQLGDGTPFLVMEYLEGRDLENVIEKEGPQGIASIPRCLHFIVQSLSGLQQAHDAGIIHRDMKPSNCFVVSKDGDDDFVKLLDFGISKVHEPSDVKLTQTNSLLGTPLYMSPEQSRSAKLADHRSDLYSMGVILYELLTGRPPFDSDSSFADLLIKIATSEPVPLTQLRPDVPPELAQVVRKAFARDPNDRFGSAFELSEALVPWCDERSSSVVERTRRRAGGSSASYPSLIPLSEPALPLVVRADVSTKVSDSSETKSSDEVVGDLRVASAEDPEDSLQASLVATDTKGEKKKASVVVRLVLIAAAIVVLAGVGAVAGIRYVTRDLQPDGAVGQGLIDNFDPQHGALVPTAVGSSNQAEPQPSPHDPASQAPEQPSTHGQVAGDSASAVATVPVVPPPTAAGTVKKQPAGSTAGATTPGVQTKPEPSVPTSPSGKKKKMSDIGIQL